MLHYAAPQDWDALRTMLAGRANPVCGEKSDTKKAAQTADTNASTAHTAAESSAKEGLWSRIVGKVTGKKAQTPAECESAAPASKPAMSVTDTVRDIMDTVRREGDDALVRYTARFDCPNFTTGMLKVSAEALAAAAEEIGAEDRAILAEAAANIRSFHEHQKEEAWFVTQDNGTILGQVVRPVASAGIYVPGGQGGNTPLISSLLMGAVPAQVAGVPRIAVITPPRADGTASPYILAAAHVLGITEVYLSGSAWAIAALAYGTQTIPAVNFIAGPGNIFVATAKRMLIGEVGIDMIAGPSEICVVADESADAAMVAADMLSQAEHDPLASAVLITPNEALAHAVQKELDAQVATLPRVQIASASLEHWGAIVITPTMEAALELANFIAPEHIELLVKNPWEIMPKVENAGAIFMGHYASESLGDYFAGPNHVLPTMGTARFSSALSVQAFCKKSSIIAASADFTQQSVEKVARLARLEGLEAHARSIETRKKA